MGDPLSVGSTALGAVSLGLQVCETLHRYYNAWASYDEDVARTAASIRNLSRIFTTVNRTISQNSIPPSHQEVIENSLLQCQESILKLDKTLKKVMVERSLPSNVKDYFTNAKRRLLYPFRESTLAKIRENALGCEAALDTAMNGLQTDLILNTQRQISIIPQRLDSIIAKMEDLVVTYNMSQISSEQQQILRWLNIPDILTTHHRQTAAKHQGTGDWIFKHSAYEAWKADTSKILWIHGIPGCGKSVLASNVIELFSSECTNSACDALLFFYFDSENPSTQKIESLLRCFVGQLCMQSDTFLDILRRYYESSGKGVLRPSDDTLAKCLDLLIPTFRRVYIIIDALDECTEQENLLKFLKKTSSPRNVSILFTSRQERNLEIELAELNPDSLDIQESQIDDISKYLTDVVPTDKILSRWAAGVCLEIRVSLMEKADGMFQWVVCQLAELRKCLSLEHLRECLKDLPRDLNSTYERIISNIDARYRRQTALVLHWLVYSQRPLSVEEAAEILAVDTYGSPIFDSSRRLREAEDILIICSSLVTVNIRHEKDLFESSPPQRELSLSHLSVRDFLLVRDPFMGFKVPIPTQGHLLLAETCLTYISVLTENGGAEPENIDRFPLWEYAASNWHVHARRLEQEHITASEKLDSMAMDLFMNKTKLFAWNRLYDVDSTRSRTRFQLSLEDLAPPLYYVAAVGLVRYVNPTFSISFQDGVYSTPRVESGTPLIVAARKGFSDVVNELIDRGYPIDSHFDETGTALQAAATNADLDMVALFLTKGANVNCVAGFYGSALQSAAVKGHVEVVRTLIDNGADVNLSGGRHGSALSAATYGGHEDVVSLLLDNHAKINRMRSRSREFYCRPPFDPMIRTTVKGRFVLDFDFDPLFIAAYNWSDGSSKTKDQCYARIAKSILQRLGVATKDTQYIGEMLYVAALGGNEVIAQYLLDEESAKASSFQEYIQSALFGALRAGSEKIVRKLLSHGAQILDDRPWIQREFLYSAAVSNCPSLIELLFSHGLKPTNMDMVVAFLSAIKADCSQDVLQILLSQGLDLQHGRWDKYILTTCRGVSPEVLPFILERTQVNVNSLLDEESALIREARDGNPDNLTTWLKFGANVNMVHGRYGCALNAAICAANTERVQILLKAGADPNVAAGKGPPLVTTLEYYHPISNPEAEYPDLESRNFIKACVSLLLEYQVDVNKTGRSTMPPLCIAIARGLDGVASLLLRSGADKSKTDRFGRNALFWAVARNNKDLLITLEGKQIDQSYLPTLLRAAMGRRLPRMFQFLLDRITDFRTLDENGYSFGFNATYFKNSALAAKTKGSDMTDIDSDAPLEDRGEQKDFGEWLWIGASDTDISVVSQAAGTHVTMIGNQWNSNITFRSRFPVTSFGRVAYFEVKILQLKDKLLRVGICNDFLRPHRGLGIRPGACISSSGTLTLANDGEETLEYRVFPVADGGNVIGCGIDYTRNSIIFTRGPLFIDNMGDDKMENWYFAFSTAAEQMQVEVNCGQSPFVFDLQGWQEGRLTAFNWLNADWDVLDKDVAEEHVTKDHIATDDLDWDLDRVFRFPESP